MTGIELETGIARIAAERTRQIEQLNYTPEWDSGYNNKQLSQAAACYLLAYINDNKEISKGWPWYDTYWKPGDDIRMLEKAGALIAAEIDRLNNLEKKSYKDGLREARNIIANQKGMNPDWQKHLVNSIGALLGDNID